MSYPHVNQGMTPLKYYKEETITYLKTKHGMSNEEAEQMADDIVEERLKDPEIRHFHRPDGADTHPEEVSLLTMLANTLKSNRIMVPTGTVYESPKKAVSFLSKQIGVWLAARKLVKAEQFVLEMDEKFDEAEVKQRKQLDLKRNANAVSGLVTSFSSFHCKSIHNTLTSTTAMSTSIANANNERFIAGNMHFRNVQVVIAYIVSCITHTNLVDVRILIDKYNLHEPTIDETVETLWESSKLYFTAPKFKREIEAYVVTLSGLERATCLYLGSLYNIRKYNPEFVYDLFNAMLGRDEDFTTEDPVKYMRALTGEELGVVHHKRIDVMMGVKTDYKSIAVEQVADIAKDGKALETALSNYRDFLDTLIITDVLPPEPIYVNTMVRRIIVLSDTDSTCFTTEEWIDWYSNMAMKYDFAASLGVMACIGLLATEALDFSINQFAKNMGIDDDDIGIIAYKNEFSWPVFIRASNAAKHYLADTFSKEGNIFKKSILEAKGVNFKGTSKSAHVIKETYAVAETIFKTVLTNEPIDVDTLVDKHAKMDIDLRMAVMDGDLTYLTPLNIKDPAFYKAPDPINTNYRYLMVWNALFGDLFTAEAPARFVNVNLNINNTTKLRELTDSVARVYPDKAQEVVDLLFTRMKKKDMNTFYLPAEYVEHNGLPDLLKPFVNLDSMSLKLLSPMKMLLEACGHYS